MVDEWIRGYWARQPVKSARVNHYPHKKNATKRLMPLDLTLQFVQVCRIRLGVKQAQHVPGLLTNPGVLPVIQVSSVF